MAVAATKQAPNVSVGVQLPPTNTLAKRPPLSVGVGSAPAAPPSSTGVAAPSWGPNLGGGIAHSPLLPSAPLPPPAAIPQSNYVVGSDTVSFTVKPGQTITVTFPNLPTRSTVGNPLGLRQVASNVAVRPYDTLHFAVALQNVSGGTPTVTPLAIDQARARCPGSFLGGGNTYGVFQAVIKGGSTAASGTVVGTLTYQVAS